MLLHYAFLFLEFGQLLLKMLSLIALLLNTLLQSIEIANQHGIQHFDILVIRSPQPVLHANNLILEQLYLSLVFSHRCIRSQHHRLPYHSCLLLPLLL